MEKLLELLNERETGEEGGEMYYISNGVIRDDGGNILYDYRITSKEFGFIKRLVENDKIDRDKCGFKNEGLSGNWYDSGIAFVQNYDNDTYKVSEFYSPYLQLLMLLSISNSPIYDLILYLK